jgi:hypothetical protein
MPDALPWFKTPTVLTPEEEEMKALFPKDWTCLSLSIMRIAYTSLRPTIDLGNELTLSALARHSQVPRDRILEMLNLAASSGIFDRDEWEQHRILNNDILRQGLEQAQSRSRLRPKQKPEPRSLSNLTYIHTHREEREDKNVQEESRAERVRAEEDASEDSVPGMAFAHANARAPALAAPTDLQSVEVFFTNHNVADARAEASKFFDHYESNGWRQSRGLPIRKWEAAARSWINKIGQFEPAASDRPAATHRHGGSRAAATARTGARTGLTAERLAEIDRMVESGRGTGNIFGSY